MPLPVMIVTLLVTKPSLIELWIPGIGGLIVARFIAACVDGFILACEVLGVRNEL